MKKMTVIGILLFIIYPNIFADGNSIDFKNIFYNWQLYSYKIENQKINFSNLNPLFFGNFNDYFLINVYENIDQNNNNNKNRQAKYVNPNATGFNLLGIFIYYTGLIFGGTYMYNHPLVQNIYNDTWKQQEEMKSYYLGIYRDNLNY